MLRFGRFLELATGQPDFPDPPWAEIVAATQNCLRDKIPLWHGTMSKQRSEEILSACFNES